jgi:hypothetical protein
MLLPKKGVLILGALALTAGVSAGAAEWIARIESDKWDWIEKWINEECKPKDLQGIQLVSVQLGHKAPYRIAVFCRKDGSSAKYKIGLITFNGEPEMMSRSKALLANQNVQLGPTYYDVGGSWASLWYVEKVN